MELHKEKDKTHTLQQKIYDFLFGKIVLSEQYCTGSGV